jgi:hypothetical protein
VQTAVALNSYGVVLLQVGELEGSRAALEHATRLLEQSQDAPEQLRQAVARNLAAVIHQLGIADTAQAPDQQRHADAEPITEDAPDRPKQ